MAEEAARNTRAKESEDSAFQLSSVYKLVDLRVKSR